MLTTSQWILTTLWISTAKYCFLVNLRYKSENLNKIWNLKIQCGGRQQRHLFNYCCHENQLDATWFHLIKSTNEACYMYQVSCQSDELCQKEKGGGGPIDPPQGFV